ncbi:snapalysin family zinc-dependent metalloprotease [Streptomyces fimicarius]|uniref:snapalysin family zinc-dependent metalloprotease n=1 Tax=Streptomyces griseus TaxID=1911 RepID=UPI0036CE4BBD
MMRKRLMSTVVAVLCTSAVAFGAGVPAGAAEPGPEVIPIDLLEAGSYADAAREAIGIWNRAVPSIKFVEQETPATLRVKGYTTQNGTQSHAFVSGLGTGWVYLETGDAETYKPSRIAVHELGHLLSLPDLEADAEKPCSKVMSGAHAGPECTNDQPDAEEIAAVAAFFAEHDLGDPVPGWGGTTR